MKNKYEIKRIKLKIKMKRYRTPLLNSFATVNDSILLTSTFCKMVILQKVKEHFSHFTDESDLDIYMY